jgi:pyruvate dehydrogenase (quinone)
MVDLEMMVDGLPPYGTGYPHTDYAAIATAAGARGIRVDKPGDVRGALREAFAHDGPALVDVVTDPNALAVPPKITSEQVTGFALSASRTVLGGGVGRMIHLARTNLRNIPRP